MADLLKAERRLLLALLLLVVLANVPYGRWVLYPFALFSTWVHELCHGVAAMAVGGEIEWLRIHSDTSGLARTQRPPGALNRAFIASAGYVGTAVVGAVMLAGRRWERAARVGIGAFGVAMVLSVVLWVRNPFGVLALLIIGGGLIAAGRSLGADAAANVYAFLAATCSLNALTNIQQLLRGGTMRIDGEVVDHSDAHTVADALFGPSWLWAGLWLILAVALTAAGLRLGYRKAATTD